MPFNGSGVFSRTQNWSSDATNNLPISASKFDNEDNDFATAFNNCLTRDGQGTPTSALTWTTVLTLTKASDGAELVVGRTGGSNNPSFQVVLTDASSKTALNNTLAGGTVSLSVNGTDVLAVTASAVTLSQATTITPPAASVGLAITGVANQYSEVITASSTSGQSFGLKILGGTTSADAALLIQNQGASTSFAEIFGDGHGFIRPTAATGLSWDVNGSFTIAAPAAGTALLATGVGGQNAIIVESSGTSGNNYGIRILAGTTSADWGFRVDNNANSAVCFMVQGDGETYVTAPTAAVAGPTGTFQVGYLEAPQNLQNASYQLVMSDRGKQIMHTSGSPHTYTIPANGTVAFPLGTMIVVSNSGAGAVTIAITTDTLTWVPGGTTGSRTLSQNGSCTLQKITSTSWFVSGVGIS
jgi:hypothetical protein